MADSEHLKLLKQGADIWNKWRERDFYVRADLRQADLQGINLAGYYLGETDLSGVDLSKQDLESAQIEDSNCSESKLNQANLANAKLTQTNFFRADLIRANLEGANLQAADFRQADLRGAILRGAYLGGADLTRANLDNADISGAYLNATVFGDNDLSVIKGLEAVLQGGPSIIGIDTIYRSKGNIPEVFLRGCGVPKDFITYMRSLVVQPIQFYSCFISYSNKNRSFVERLYADLQSVGVRCWLAPEDLKIGKSSRLKIDESIRLYDKLLLVLSEDSIQSSWVETEVESALSKERKPNRNVLYPIRIDDSILRIKTGWAAYIRNTHNIADFSRWKNYDSYQKALTRLLRDLSPEVAALKSGRSESKI